MSGFDMSIYDIPSNMTQTISITPVQIECAPDLTNIIDLSWKIVLVFVVAWAARQLIFTAKTS
ncbi:hypothetical protein [Nitrosomonas communis]|uniref:hypothetical protein n=1 Tax=Nitrosomonas communis TaxID=44574 RepID=UPI00116058B4|nr:hypothetical protein [Nitrosomonas communis]